MDYSKVTMEEYQDKKLEMLNSLGRTSGFCKGIPCLECPLNRYNGDSYKSKNCKELELLYPLKAIGIVMKYEPKIDWTNVKVDTPILVRDESGDWIPRYFAKYENNEVYVWMCGQTSLTQRNGMLSYECAKLYKESEV